MPLVGEGLESFLLVKILIEINLASKYFVNNSIRFFLTFILQPNTPPYMVIGIYLFDFKVY